MQDRRTSSNTKMIANARYYRSSGVCWWHVIADSVWMKSKRASGTLKLCSCVMHSFSDSFVTRKEMVHMRDEKITVRGQKARAPRKPTRSLKNGKTIACKCTERFYQSCRDVRLELLSRSRQIVSIQMRIQKTCSKQRQDCWGLRLWDLRWQYWWPLGGICWQCVEDWSRDIQSQAAWTNAPIGWVLSLGTSSWCSAQSSPSTVAWRSDTLLWDGCTRVKGRMS